MLGAWRGSGHRVTVVRGLDRNVRGDVAIQHVDCSVVPPDYAELAAGFPVVVNGLPRDIRKRTISRQLVRPGDGWTGPVIIKSDLNFGGIPENMHNQAAAAHQRPLPHREAPTFNDYPILRSAADVPESSWSRPHCVVERFVPERDERGFWLRTWVFFGDRERCNRHCSRSPIVKAGNAFYREPAAVPDEIREERRRLGFDYGKFDFVVVGNHPILIDANRTPGGSPTLTDEMARGAAALAGGIDVFLERARAA